MKKRTKRFPRHKDLEKKGLEVHCYLGKGQVKGKNDRGGVTELVRGLSMKELAHGDEI